MIFIVGLGNPGKKFYKTRHNVGFWILDEFRKTKNFPEFRLSKKFLAEISEGFSGGKKIILAKPQTFMNGSGRAVKSIIKASARRVPPTSTMDEVGRQYDNLWVIHDDIDLPLGKIKIVKNRGSAGHKGVQSIVEGLGTRNFIRFRVGIRPKEIKDEKQETESFVLKNFNKKEEGIIKKTAKKTVKVMEFVLNEGLERAMTEYNQ